MRRILGAVVTILGCQPVVLPAQMLEREVDTVVNGTVRMSFAARPGTCGDGMNTIRTRQESEDWENDCDTEPVRVALRVREGRVTGIRTYIGGRWRPGGSAIDLGMVKSQEAAAYLLRLAAGDGELAGDPVLPATLADSAVIWPSLLRLARDKRLPEERRHTAVFWLGQAAGAAVGQALDSIVEDENGERGVRKQAVFALSQRPADESVPALIRIVRTNSDPELRKSALFWLGQSEDPRALDLFEEILR